MIDFFSRSPIESGGIFGAQKGVVCRFCPDRHAVLSDEYRPNVEFLNRKIAEWEEEEILFIGIAHSHPNGLLRLSSEDMRYAKEIISRNPHLKELKFAVAASRKNTFQLAFYDCMREDERREFRTLRLHKIS